MQKIKYFIRMDQRLDNLMTFERIFHAESFKFAAKERFNVQFENSAIEEISKKLEQLRQNVHNDIHTGKHVGFAIELPLVIELQERFETILSDYRSLTNTKHIPSTFKLYEVTEKLRSRVSVNGNNEKIDQLHYHLVPTKETHETKREIIRRKAKMVAARDIGGKK